MEYFEYVKENKLNVFKITITIFGKAQIIKYAFQISIVMSRLDIQFISSGTYVNTQNSSNKQTPLLKITLFTRNN